jgi:hypothetical protein
MSAICANCFVRVTALAGAAAAGPPVLRTFTFKFAKLAEIIGVRVVASSGSISQAASASGPVGKQVQETGTLPVAA